MIKCTNECPLSKFDGCCAECPSGPECEDRCAMEPQECREAVFEGTNLEVFQGEAAMVIQTITNLAGQKAEIEEAERAMRGQLQKAMEKHGVKSFDNDLIKITYIDASKRTSVDSEKLKNKYPKILEECSKTSNIKAFVKIELKKVRSA